MENPGLHSEEQESLADVTGGRTLSSSTTTICLAIMPATPVNSHPESRLKLPKNQYHHCIPRFILRQFMTEPPPTQTKRERRLSFRQARKHKEEYEPIFFYEISTGILQYRSLSKVYGEKNLYRDLNASQTTHVDHLEMKLSQLEQEAANVIYQIKKGITQRHFVILRRDLSTLRKFIFLMHYRNNSVSSTYFQETSPNNAPLADWIRRYKTTHNLHSDFDVWLDGLKYYLRHSHQDMVAAGERLRERYGEHRLHEMLRRRLDPEIEEAWYAIEYETVANYFFLGVWEAADGTEFVLGGNGFGLWEGLIYGTPGAHRLYVVSPRLAIVLRRTFLRHPVSNDPSILYSSLANIKINAPIVEHANPSVFTNLDQDSDPAILRNVRDAYRCSKQAQEDKFTFSITKLDKEQTYAVNEVVMMNANLHPTGSLTFASTTAMLETLNAYMSSHNTFLGGKRSLFRPLLHELIRSSGAESPTAVTSLDKPWDVDTDADLQLHMFLRFAVTNGVSFPSDYNRAYLIYHMATDIPSLVNPVSVKIRSIQRLAIQRLRESLDPPLLPDFSPPTNYILVETLPKDESELFFALVGHQIDQLQVGRHSNDILANIIYEASMVGVAHWLVENRPDVLFDFVGHWVGIVIHRHP